jgi:hypothetical protein
MAEGTRIVQEKPVRFDRRAPDGPPLFQGDPRVVDAWNLRARRELRTLRLVVVGAVAAAVGLAAADAVPAVFALATLGALAVVYPLALVSAGGRAAQRAFEIHELGVHATERRRLLRFRRFAPFPEIVRGEARERAPGKFEAALLLFDGTQIASIPGELSREAVEYLNARTGEQVRIA